MAPHDPDTDPAAFLGRELKRARQAAGFSSQDALSARLGFDRSVITKAENGDRPPSPDVLSAWCEATGLDSEHFGRLGVLARRAGRLVPEWFGEWLETEREAHLSHIVELLEQPNISVQVVPSQTGANAGLSGAFDLASGDGSPEVLRMEAVQDVTSEARSLVRRAAGMFVRVQADALPRAASRALILEAAEQWKTR